MADTEIKTLSLNCWGLKYIAKNRDERIEAISQALSNTDRDIIALQEIWVYSDYEKVRDSVSKRLTYAKFFYSGALGAGLAIFSRFPIVSTSVTPYSLNGVPIDVAAGDWFVGKAAASAVILHPVLGQVQIFNTHLFAKGGEDGPEFLRAHRLVGSWEFAKLARAAAEQGRYVIALGDFNSIPPTLPMTIILDHASLTDSWAQLNPGAETGPQPTTALESIERHGITADSPHNSWSAGKAYSHGWGKRLDYCLYRQPLRPAPHPSSPDTISVLRAAECKVVFTDNVPGRPFSYSDHFGLETTLRIEPSYPADANWEDVPRELSTATMEKAIHAWMECYRVAKVRSKKELAVFVSSLTACIAITVASVWFPQPWITPIFILVVVVFAWLATTFLYHGFLYGNWECNALMNAIEDMEYHRNGIELLKTARYSDASTTGGVN
ncbi:inositol phosphorylsphingolipid-phospholipase C [Coprinopsis sp. MPI-PUGE-AT-0042]|nr:inositol phosphorylsphingolipid-phospholipase C [Coprinopsis sp. MPI-PUGE-AT-0042]